MRRPAPLPGPPAPPQSVPSTATRAPSGRRAKDAAPVPADPALSPSAWSASPDPAEPASDEAGFDATGPDGAGPDDDGRDSAAEDAPVTSRDVWRAARARRKALRAEIRRFTKGARRRRLVWLGGLGAVLVLIAGCVAAAYSPLFALERITVVGTQALDAATVESALAGQIGTPLALIDEGEIKKALTGFPLIETYALEARPPHELTVRIVERTPVGVIESAAGYTLVDQAGVALATTAARPEGQPVLEIQGGAGTAAFSAAGIIVRSVPAGIRDQLVRVSASSADDVTLRLASGTTVVWGSTERSPEKAIVLERTMEAHPGAAHYDVSSPDAVVVG